MTQLQSLQAVPSSGRRSFTLEVRDKLGQGQKALYSSQEPGGVAFGFASRRYPSGTCGPLTFQGKPSELDIENGDITYLSYDTGQRLIPVHMGVVVSAPFEDGPEWGTYEVASGKKLLERSVCDKENGWWIPPAPVDAAAVLRFLTSSFKHAALKYRDEKIPYTGVPMNAINARATRLDRAISAVLKALPDIGENDWGVDPEGYIVIRPPEGVVTLPYRQVKAQFGGSISSDDVVTKATIRVANTVSEGAIVSAGYKPGLVTYTYEAPEHRFWGAEQSFDLTNEADNAGRIIDVVEFGDLITAGGSTEWKSSVTNSIADAHLVVGDGRLDTYIYPAGTSNRAFRYFNYYNPAISVNWLGGGLVIDAPPGAYELRLDVAYGAATSGNDFTPKYIISYDLTNLKGRGQVEARYLAPPPTEKFQYAHTMLFLTGTIPANLKLYEFRPIRANIPLLDKIARAQIKLPARELAEIDCAYGPQDENGFLLETVGKTFVAEGAPTPITGTIAEIVDTFNTQDGMRSKIALGAPVRDEVVTAIQRFVRGAR